METNLKIVNEHLKFKKVSLIEPTNNHFLHIAAEIDTFLFPFFITTSQKKISVIELAKSWCRKLENEENIISATVFKAVLIPPGKGKFLKERSDKVQTSKYDFVILIESNSNNKIKEIQSSASYKEIIKKINKSSKSTHIISATNVKRINPVNHKKQGIFLFNYFFSDSLQQNLDVWEYTAGWFQQETGLDNSTLLLPIEQDKSKYSIINHCRWDKMRNILPSLFFKKTFRTYVLDNFYANKVAAMPILYKIV